MKNNNKNRKLLKITITNFINSLLRHKALHFEPNLDSDIRMRMMGLFSQCMSDAFKKYNLSSYPPHSGWWMKSYVSLNHKTGKWKVGLLQPQK